jgi:type III secretion system (T3SS) SseB-like protein
VGLFKKKKQPQTAPADAKVYYSTPFGDTKDGRQKLFLLERDGVRYVPVFRSVESMKEFYERTNRAGYMILEGDVKSVMETNRSIELMKSAGIVIEPLSDHPVEIMPDA